jgi:hypothetical protein
MTALLQITPEQAAARFEAWRIERGLTPEQAAWVKEYALTHPIKPDTPAMTSRTRRALHAEHFRDPCNRYAA